MNHAMIDIETLDTATTAVVLSVGLCRFSTRPEVATTATTVLYLDVQEQLDAGRTVSVATLNWWREQSPEVWHRQLDGHLPVATAGTEVLDAVGSADYIWANDPHFDLRILNNLLGFEVGKFWTYRSLRTIKHIANIRGAALPMRDDDDAHDVDGVALPPRDDDAHDAGVDAAYQARVVRACWTALELDHDY